MRKALLAALFVILIAGYGAVASATAAPQASAPPVKPADPAKPEAKPISLSPLIPVPDKPVDGAAGPSKAADSADPSKMAEPSKAAGTFPKGISVGPSYVIGPEDILRVLVWEDPKFSGSFKVRPDGMISLPLAGEIMAAGLTPSKLEASINEVLKQYLKTPHATVEIEGAHSKKIYFDGDGIAQPGPMDYVVPIRFLEAISSRGGFKDFANKKKIEIWRDGKTIMKVNYNDIIKGKHPEQNIWLQPDDHVIVN